jgi:hypothetical protein
VSGRGAQAARRTQTRHEDEARRAQVEARRAQIVAKVDVGGLTPFYRI